MLQNQSQMGILDRILKTPRPKDRLSKIEEQIQNMAFYFNRENEELKEKVTFLESAVLNKALTPNEAGKILKITGDMVRRHLADETIEGYKDGARWKTTVKSVLDYMKRMPRKYGESITLSELIKYTD